MCLSAWWCVVSIADYWSLHCNSLVWLGGSDAAQLPIEISVYCIRPRPITMAAICCRTACQFTTVSACDRCCLHSCCYSCYFVVLIVVVIKYLACIVVLVLAWHRVRCGHDRCRSQSAMEYINLSLEQSVLNTNLYMYKP